jgi:hypothetical protein
MTVGDLIMNYKADFTVLTFYRVTVVTAGSGTIDTAQLTTVTP